MQMYYRTDINTYAPFPRSSFTKDLVPLPSKKVIDYTYKYIIWRVGDDLQETNASREFYNPRGTNK